MPVAQREVVQSCQGRPVGGSEAPRRAVVVVAGESGYVTLREPDTHGSWRKFPTEGVDEMGGGVLDRVPLRERGREDCETPVEQDTRRTLRQDEQIVGSTQGKVTTAIHAVGSGAKVVIAGDDDERNVRVSNSRTGRRDRAVVNGV
jgi:hypothetical protein